MATESAEKAKDENENASGNSDSSPEQPSSPEEFSSGDEPRAESQNDPQDDSQAKSAQEKRAEANDEDEDEDEDDEDEDEGDVDKDEDEDEGALDKDNADKDPHEDDEDEDEEDDDAKDEGDEDEDEDEEDEDAKDEDAKREKPAAKPADRQPAAKPPAKPVADKAAAAAATDKPSARKPAVGASKAAKPRSGAKKQVAHRSGFSMRNVLLFSGLVVALLAAFGVLGSRNSGGGPVSAPRWKINDVVNVEITVVTTDYKDLGCAMDGEVAGRYCAFLAPNMTNEKAKTSRDDDKLLQPFSTTDRINFLASGFFMQPDLKKKLDDENFERPSPRFNVNCKLKVEGRAKVAKVQWKQGDAWAPGDNWFTGPVSDCKIAR